MHTTRETSKTTCADVYRLANVIAWCLLWRWWCNDWVKQPNKLLSATIPLLFYLILNIDSTKYRHIRNEGNQKSIKTKLFCRFESLWNVHKPHFTLIPWATPKSLGQKIWKFIIRFKLIVASNFLHHSLFSSYQYLLNLQLIYFCKFSCKS